jgi:hypothetical protein
MLIIFENLRFILKQKGVKSSDYFCLVYLYLLLFDVLSDWFITVQHNHHNFVDSRHIWIDIHAYFGSTFQINRNHVDQRFSTWFKSSLF